MGVWFSATVFIWWWCVGRKAQISHRKIGYFASQWWYMWFFFFFLEWSIEKREPYVQILTGCFSLATFWLALPLLLLTLVVFTNLYSNLQSVCLIRTRIKSIQAQSFLYHFHPAEDSELIFMLSITFGMCCSVSKVRVLTFSMAKSSAPDLSLIWICPSAPCNLMMTGDMAVEMWTDVRRGSLSKERGAVWKKRLGGILCLTAVCLHVRRRREGVIKLPMWQPRYTPSILQQHSGLLMDRQIDRQIENRHELSTVLKTYASAWTRSKTCLAQRIWCMGGLLNQLKPRGPKEGRGPCDELCQSDSSS